MKPKERDVLNLIKQDKAYEDYFFKKASGRKWFSELKEQGYFSPKNNPSPQKTENGSYRIPEWNVLSYLEKVSKKTKDDEIIDSLSDIIIKVTKNGKDNNRTWWFFVKIISNFPNDKIDNEILNLIPLWLDSQFGNDLVASEIIDNLLGKFLNNYKNNYENKIFKIINSLLVFEEVENKNNIFISQKKYNFKVNNYNLKKIIKKYENNLRKASNISFIKQIIKKIKKLLKKRKSSISFNKHQKTFNLYLERRTNSELIIKVEDESDKTLYRNKFTMKKINSDFVNDIKNKNIFDNDEIDLISSYVKKMIINLYSKGTYKSFYNKEKDKLYINDKPLGFLTLFLKKLLIKNNNFNDRESLLKKLLMEDYLYFKKLFLFLVTKDIDKFENIFWDNFNTNNVDLLIKEYYFADELRHFFNSLSELSNKHCKILEDKIEEGPNHLKTMNLENVENYILLWKQKRFKALSHLDYFKDIYKNYLNNTGREVQLAPALGKIQVSYNKNSSPLSEEEILAMSNKKLANYIKNFKPQNDWDESNIEGLSTALKNVVSEKPNKFSRNLDPFIKIKNNYIYEIILGFKTAFKNGKNLKWVEIINFMERCINEFNLSENEKIKNKDIYWVDKNNLMGEFSELIKIGLKRNDEKLLNDLSARVYSLLDNILDNIEIKDNSYTDAITEILNTTFGRVVDTLIILLFNIDEENSCYDEIFKELIDLENKEVEELYTLFGAYLYKFNNKDSDWTFKRLKVISENKKAIYNFSYGFLSFNYIKLEILDNKIREMVKKIIIQFLEFDLTKNMERTTMNRIALHYLFSSNNIEDSHFFKQILKNWKVSYINQIINYLVINKTQIKEKKPKVLDFWDKSIEKLSKISKEDLNKNSKIMSNLNKLIVFLDKLDEKSYRQLMFTARYSYIQYNDNLFVENLDRLKDKGEDKGEKQESAFYVGKIYKEILKNSIPEYKKENIRSIIEYFFQSNDSKINRIGREICELYAKNGKEYIVENIYDEYN